IMMHYPAFITTVPHTGDQHHGLRSITPIIFATDKPHPHLLTYPHHPHPTHTLTHTLLHTPGREGLLHTLSHSPSTPRYNSTSRFLGDHPFSGRVIKKMYSLMSLFMVFLCISFSLSLSLSLSLPSPAIEPAN